MIVLPLICTLKLWTQSSTTSIWCIYCSAGAHPVTAQLIRYAVPLCSPEQALKQLGIDKLMVDKLKNQFDDM
jgi:hypothetical protein